LLLSFLIRTAIGSIKGEALDALFPAVDALDFVTGRVSGQDGLFGPLGADFADLGFALFAGLHDIVATFATGLMVEVFFCVLLAQAAGASAGVALVEGLNPKYVRFHT
jgi:hypothetical protein